MFCPRSLPREITAAPGARVDVRTFRRACAAGQPTLLSAPFHSDFFNLAPAPPPDCKYLQLDRRPEDMRDRLADLTDGHTHTDFLRQTDKTLRPALQLYGIGVRLDRFILHDLRDVSEAFPLALLKPLKLR